MPFSAALWPVWGRHAAAFPRFEASYWIQMWRFRPRDGPPCRCVPLFLRGWLWGLVLSLPEVRRRPGTGLPTFSPHPAPPSPSPSPASPVQASLSLAKALPKALFYRIQRCRSRPRERSVFRPFVARLGPPCRCVSPF